MTIDNTQQVFSSVSLPKTDSLRRLAVSESGFVFDPVSGHHFTVNETGLKLLRRMQKDQKLSEVLVALADEYDIGKRDLERDVLEFLGLLKEFVGD